MTMSLFTIISLLNFISPLSLSILTIKKGERSKVTFLWALICLCVSFWGLGGIIASTAKTKEIAYVGWQVANICAIPISSLFYHFTCELLGLHSPKRILFIYLLSSLFLYFNFFHKELFLGNLNYVFNEYYYISFDIQKNPIYLLFYILFYWFLLE